ncbi:MAG TPA: ABC transporter permease [Methylomirabilota bacterium]|nr:ABC transporter permease [Methylomirabilota bacterium]
MTRFLVWAREFRAYRTIVDGLAQHPGLRFLGLAAGPLAWILMANLAPLVQMIAISLQDRYPLPPGEAAVWTLRHYQAFIDRPLYLNAFLRSFVFATAMTLLTLAVMFPVAYYLSKVAPAGWRVRLLLLVVAPFWVSEIVRSFAWMLMLANSGAVNAALMAAGVTDGPVELLYNRISLTVGVLYLSSLYMLLPLYAAIEKIEDKVIEAAADLGAGPVRRFWRVILPLSREGIVAGCTLVFLLTVGLYAMPQLLGGPGDTLFAATIGQVFGRAGDSWPLGSAFSIILILAALAYVGLFAALLLRRGSVRSVVP